MFFIFMGGAVPFLGGLDILSHKLKYTVNACTV